MPVLVANADAPLGARLARRLLDEGGEVRVYGRGSALDAVRSAGAFAAVGDPDDEGRIEAAMAGVHTVVRAEQGLLDESASQTVVAARTLARAAANAGVRRVVWLSLPGADPEAGDGLRSAHGLAEQALVDADVPTVVVRASLVEVPAVVDALAQVRPASGVASRQIAPVRQVDLIELLVGIDALRSQAQTGHVTLAADGPECTTVGGYLERCRRPDADGRRFVGRTYRPPAATPLLGSALDGPWISRDTGFRDAWALASVRPRSFLADAPSP